MFAAATFILWIPKIVVATREYKINFSYEKLTKEKIENIAQ